MYRNTRLFPRVHRRAAQRVLGGAMGLPEEVEKRALPPRQVGEHVAHLAWLLLLLLPIRHIHGAQEQTPCAVHVPISSDFCS
jgi:hypothetical protein